MPSIIVGDTKVTYNGEKKVITTAMYGWTKWGGSNMGLVQKNLDPEWNCQACGDLQTEELSPYMFEFIPREYIRICSICHFIRIKQTIKEFKDLIEAVRKRHDLYDELVANIP